jgi:hypothetical protein
MSTTTCNTPSVDIFAAIQNQTKEKSSSKVPVVAIAPELETKLRELMALKSALKDAEGHRDLLIAEVIPTCEQLRRDLSVEYQRHLTSISLQGVSTLICQNKYTAIPISEEPRLRQIFNGKFNEFFLRKTDLAVDVEKLRALAETEPAIAEAVALLAKHEVLAKNVTLKPTEVFHTARSVDSNIAALADSAGLKPTTFIKS